MLPVASAVQTFVAKLNNTNTDISYCFGVFRETTPVWEEWITNLVPGLKAVCPDGEGSACCSVHRGFDDAYNVDFRNDLETAVRKCAASCTGSCPFVLTVHSQGSGLAGVAALYLSGLDPTVLTYGMPRTVELLCSIINPTK
jgi:hypothetical protein